MRNYSGEFTPTVAVTEPIARRKVRLVELVNINLEAGTAIYVGTLGIRHAVVRCADGWFTNPTK